MKILVLTGSPHKNGTSALLADEFIRGAKEGGHEVERFDAAFENVHPCIGCGKCGYGKAPCVFRDSMEKLHPLLVAADVIAFVTPIYYWGMSAQLKAVIDRFQVSVFSMQGRKKALLMTTSASGEKWVTDPIEAQFGAMLKFMDWRDGGRLLARGCAARADIEASSFPLKAYEAGKRIGE